MTETDQTPAASTPRSYFEEMYRQPDPWGFESEWYEHRKYAITLASLPRERYRRGFEPGCANGALTESLSERCAELVAFELHPEAAERARRRLGSQPHVEVQEHEIPADWPTGTFDLVVLSEIAYYFDDERHAELERRVGESLQPGGDLVLVHWTGPTDYPLTGDQVHDRWARSDDLEPLAAHRDDGFRLDVLRRRERDST